MRVCFYFAIAVHLKCRLVEDLRFITGNVVYLSTCAAELPLHAAHGFLERFEVYSVLFEERLHLQASF